MSRIQLLILCLALLSAVVVGWIARAGLWRRHRLAIIGGGVLFGLLMLTRRLGWQELLIVAGVVLLAFLMVPAARRR